eukprot:gene13492-9299_t
MKKKWISSNSVTVSVSYYSYYYSFIAPSFTLFLLLFFLMLCHCYKQAGPGRPALSPQHQPFSLFFFFNFLLRRTCGPHRAAIDISSLSRYGTTLTVSEEYYYYYYYLVLLFIYSSLPFFDRENQNTITTILNYNLEEEEMSSHDEDPQPDPFQRGSSKGTTAASKSRVRQVILFPKQSGDPSTPPASGSQPRAPAGLAPSPPSSQGMRESSLPHQQQVDTDGHPQSHHGQYVLPNRPNSPPIAGGGPNATSGNTVEAAAAAAGLNILPPINTTEDRLPVLNVGKNPSPVPGDDSSRRSSKPQQQQQQQQHTSIVGSGVPATCRECNYTSPAAVTNVATNHEILQSLKNKLEDIHKDIKQIQTDVRSSGATPRQQLQQQQGSKWGRGGNVVEPHPPAGTASGLQRPGHGTMSNKGGSNHLTAESIAEAAQSILGKALVDSPSGSSGSNSSASSSSSTSPKAVQNAASKSSLAQRAKKPTLGFSHTTPGKIFNLPEDKPSSTRKRHPVANIRGEVVQSEPAVVVEVGRKHNNSPHNNAAAAAGVDHARAADGLDRITRRRSAAAKNRREHFFAPIPLLTEVADPKRLGDRQYMDGIMLTSAPCSWLCCISMAISYVTGVPTPIEKVLRANHLAVHYIALSSITLSEMFDLVHDYIYNCFESEDFDVEECKRYLNDEEIANLRHVHAEMATFDTDLVDIDGAEKDESTGMGEHAPIPDAAKFRKELLQNINDERSLYIFNYDPYIIEEEEIRLKCNLAETEEEQDRIRSSARYPKSNKGNFGILLSFNPVQHTVTILTPHLTLKQHPMQFSDTSHDNEAMDHLHHWRMSEEEQKEWYTTAFQNVVLEEHTISMQALYQAVHQRDPYSKLYRGFVRVFVNDKVAPRIPPIFPVFVLDGSSTGGLLSVLDVNIAPHVLGLAMTHHLAIAFLLSDTARRKQSSRNLLSKANVCDVTLRGIPVTKICQQLRLPMSMIVGESNRQSITMVFAWYTTFLNQLQISHDVRLGLVLPCRRGNAEDGSPNISEEVFLSHLQLCMDTKSIMLISFDLNMALNVKISERAEPTHFAVVIGVDSSRGVMRVADVNVKRFRKTWHLPIARMYNAVMGYGYMVASKDKDTIRALNGRDFQEHALCQAKYHLPPPTKVVARFEYPNRPYPITVLADAVERLGFRCDVERLLNFSGFHLSFFLSRHMPLEGAAMVLQNFSHYALDDAMSVETHHYVYWSENPPVNEKDPEHPENPLHRMLTEEDLVKEIHYALEKPESRKLLVKYDQEVVAADQTVWNGSDGGSYALVVEYDARRRIVVLSNADVSTYYRTFACPVYLLFLAICSWDAEAQSGRGTILLDRDRSQEALYDNTRGYDLAHSLVHHPFKPIFSSACACLALAATEMMRVVAPQRIDVPLTPSEEERKKYKRYNNIFSAEDVLYSLPNFSVHDWKMVHSKDLFHIASIAFRALRLPLVAIDLAVENPDLFTSAEAFLHACDSQTGVLTIILIAYDTDKIHGVPGNSVGIVNRVERLSCAEGGGMVQLVHGDPCRWGAYLECSVQELMDAANTIVCVQEMEEAED